MLKKYFCLLLLVGMLLTVLAPNLTSFAQDGPQAAVAYNNVNVRVGPYDQAEIIGQLMMDMVVTIHAKEDFSGNRGLWVYMTSGGLTGWVHTNYLSADRSVDWGAIPISYGQGSAAFPDQMIAMARQTLDLRSEPYREAGIGANVPVGEMVAVAGQEDLCCNGNWMFVTALRGGASGWVDDDKLMYPDSMRRPTEWSYNVPIVAPDPLGTLAEPIFPNGQIVLFSGYYRVRLRTLPDANAPLVRRLTWRDRSLYVVHGRSADGEWSYVSQLNGDLKGWIYRWYARRSLPILDSVENPTLSPPPTPILEMPATVRVNQARLRRQPSGYYPVAVWIPRGTELVVTGRSVFNRYLLTEFEGEVGWVAVSELTYEGDISLLPIWSLRW